MVGCDLPKPEPSGHFTIMRTLWKKTLKMEEPPNFKMWDEQDLSSQGSPLGS